MKEIAPRMTVERFREDEDAFRDIFFLFRRPVLRFFAKRGFSDQVAEELTQETFLRAYRGMAHFRGEARVGTWLFTIAANVWRNELRRESAEKRTSTETPGEGASRAERAAATQETEELAEEQRAEAHPSPDRGPLDEFLMQERVRLLRQALDELPPQMRLCVYLRLFQDLTYREIAVVIGLPIGTVKSRLSQAKRRLGDKLAEHFPDLEIG